MIEIAALPVWAPLTAFTTALVIVWWLVRSRFAAIELDRPNRRGGSKAVNRESEIGNR